MMIYGLLTFDRCGTSEETKQLLDIVKRILAMQPNELSLTAKVTFLLTVVFQKSDYKVIPFKALAVPEGRRSHSYMRHYIVKRRKTH